MLKRIIIFIITQMYLLKYILNKSVKIHAGTIFATSIRIAKNNNATFSGKLHYCKLQIYGNNNQITTKGDVCHTLIKIDGNNNQVIIENDVVIQKGKFVLRGSNCNIIIRKGTSIGSADIVCMGKKNSVSIEENCMLSENIDIWNTDAHPIFDGRENIVNPSESIYIDKHVWLCKGCRILKGVSIGPNSIVAMGAIVTSDIPNNVICAGIPAKIIRENINWNKQFIDL